MDTTAVFLSDLGFMDFIRLCIDNPALLITTLLVLGVIFVNGWTDAPNAIATCVSTRSMSPRAAVMMAAIFNFLGVAFMSVVSSKVAATIYKMVDFSKADPTQSDNPALVALCAALFAIVVWAIAAWWFGIPTSESHALIAGISGAAIALGGAEGIVLGEWAKVIYGLGLSTVLGLGSGFIFVKLVELLFKKANRRKAGKFFKGAQITGGAAMAFMHGAQDGLKFIGVFVLGMVLTNKDLGGKMPDVMPAMPWLIILVSLTMGIGTSIGGYKIIKAVGMDMVKLERYQGFSADLAASACLLLSSLTGIPVSTTHTKTTAIMGVGASKRLSAINWSVVKEMVLAWVLTFPGCALISFLMAKVFMMIF